MKLRLLSRPICRLAILGALPLALAACQEEKKPAEARSAQGEILPGSASDAMLPLDSVRSQPPLAPQAAASGKSGRHPGAKAGVDDLFGDTGDAGPPDPGAGPTTAADPAAAQ